MTGFVSDVIAVRSRTRLRAYIRSSTGFNGISKDSRLRLLPNLHKISPRLNYHVKMESISLFLFTPCQVVKMEDIIVHELVSESIG
jgi:hypothetical protein